MVVVLLSLGFLLELLLLHHFVEEGVIDFARLKVKGRQVVLVAEGLGQFGFGRDHVSLGREVGRVVAPPVAGSRSAENGHVRIPWHLLSDPSLGQTHDFMATGDSDLSGGRRQDSVV